MPSNRPTLVVDLHSFAGNIYVLVVLVPPLLTGEGVAHFAHDISITRQPDAQIVYKDVLEVINSYVRIIDTSGNFPEYSWNEKAILAAIDHLDEQLRTIPSNMCCLVGELYPDFASKECGPDSYLALVEEEILRVEQEYEDTEDTRRLLVILRECVETLHQAGV